ncbi:hypothetical protein OED52_18605 [Rhodococcus sp. Z13]|uniref:Uncharacterized protein n=1 Tax=Rhodococcus sacchari TaxID=2962047 RepID=A0ACD4DG19_9NOCA|nr:hypothetical protein [Rhodococcus sp. Z13]UYP18628.1 hypothetical protein OED52_18605 [Rhodococcus sp. Z13]
MLSVPWTRTVPPDAADGTYTVMVGRLRPRSRRGLLPVLVWAARMRPVLARTPGAAGHTIGVDVVRPAVWIVSAWTSRTALSAFDHGGMHRSAKVDLRTVLAPSTFAVWSCPAGALPPAWDEVRDRIDAVS